MVFPTSEVMSYPDRRADEFDSVSGRFRFSLAVPNVHFYIVHNLPSENGLLR